MVKLFNISACKKMLMAVNALLLLLFIVNTAIISPYYQDIFSPIEIENVMGEEDSENENEDESEEELEFLIQNTVLSKNRFDYKSLHQFKLSYIGKYLTIPSPPPELI
jgi:hypothetical protein